MIRQALREAAGSRRILFDRRDAAAELQRLAPAGLVAIAVVFNLVVLHAETTPVPNLNDGGLHEALMRGALHNIQNGQMPLGAWFPYLSLGSALYAHYQVFPHVIGALAAAVFGVSAVYDWSLYLLLALWPISVYAMGRLLGWDRWIAAAAALISPLLVSVSGYGYEHDSYTWRSFGVWTQLWGMWLLPLALGLSWRAVNNGKNYAAAALVIAVTVASHFLTGYLALLALVPFVLVDPSHLVRRLGRAAIVAVGSVLIASWVVVPLITQSSWSGNLQYYKGSFYFDSFGAPQVLAWLFTGQLYDSGHFPVISLLVGLGLVICVVRIRRDLRARALVAFWLLSLVLFFGRPTLGPLLNVLPGSSDLPLHRYINGVHLAGLMLAGVGAMWLARRVLAWVRHVRPQLKPVTAAVGMTIVGLAALSPAWNQVAAYDSSGADLIAQQQQADSTDGTDLAVLVDMVKSFGDGRVYAGTKGGWGHTYTVGEVPVYSVLENADVDAIGMWLNTESLSSDVETQWDESNPAIYDLFNVRYLILPQDHPLPVPATFIARSGRHTLWKVATSGYLEVVDTIGPPLVEDRNNVGQAAIQFLPSQNLRHLAFPTVAFAGAAAAPPTLDAAANAQGPAGTVTSQSADVADGVFTGTVTANRIAVVLLKTTDEPSWNVTLDGASAQPIMVAPTFVGVRVPPGTHTVAFRYAPYSLFPLWLGLGLVTLIGLIVVPRRLHVTGSETLTERQPHAESKAAMRVGGAAVTKLRHLRLPTIARSRPRKAIVVVVAVGAALVLTVAAVVNLTTSKPDAQQALDYVNAGLEAQRNGRVAEAREDYRQALAHDPRNKVAWYDLGTVDAQQGNDVLAEGDYRAALDSDGTYVPALFNLAVLRTVPAPLEAVGLYQRALQIDPNDALAHLNLGFLFHTLGRDAEARSEFAAAVRIDPTLSQRIPAGLLP